MFTITWQIYYYEVGTPARQLMGKTYYRVTLPTPTFGGVHQLECFTEELLHVRRRLPVHIDMRDLRFIKPLGVVATAMFMQSMLQRDRDIVVLFPENAGVLNYLLQVGFPELMDQLGESAWSDNFPKHATRGLRPMIKLRRFSTHQEVEDIAQQMAETFLDEGLASLLKPCHVIFSELADNVLTHSGSTGFVLAQRFEYRRGPVIDIAVGDSGIGVARALWRKATLRPKLVSDREALILAMTDGISSIPDGYRGFGLGHVSSELAAAGRRLTMRSGTAAGYWVEGERTQVRICGESIGTLAHAFIPC